MTDFAKALAACWLAILVVVALAFLLLGCASTQLVTTVRRVDSIVMLDQAGDELGRDGWRVVAVTTHRDGYVVVFERRVPQ